MNGYELRQKARRGEYLYGTMWAYNNPWQVAHVSSDDLDFIVIDTEHTPHGRRDVATMIQLIAAAGIAPLVRVPSPDPVRIRMAMDAGAHGIVLPYCEDPDELRLCIAAARYRPLKGARFAEALRLGGPPDPGTRAYLEQYNRNCFMVPMIESKPAIEGIDALLAVEGIDAVFIGPHDITVSYDVPEQWDHALVEGAIATIIRACHARGIPAGTQWWTTERVRRELEIGGRFVLYSNDLGMIMRGYRESMAEIRRHVSEVSGTGGDGAKKPSP